MPKPFADESAAPVRAALIGARKAAGVTQVQLAQRLGFTQQAVSMVETGVRRLDIIEFHSWARALGRDPVELFAEVTKQLRSGR